jgi:hypothetical protein
VLPLHASSSPLELPSYLYIFEFFATYLLSFATSSLSSAELTSTDLLTFAELLAGPVRFSAPAWRFLSRPHRLSLPLLPAPGPSHPSVWSDQPPNPVGWTHVYFLIEIIT